MKIVIETQIMENYGAHDWDGEGECPQYWKAKGGETYVITGVTVAQAQDPDFWAAAEAQCVESNESWQEYIIGSELIDDIDPIPGDAEWLKLFPPVVLQLKDGVWLGERRRMFGWADAGKPVGEIQRWVNRESQMLSYILADGSEITYAEWRAQVA